MAQEQVQMDTVSNSASNGILPSLGNFLGSLGTTAASLYSLKLQNETLQQQNAAQQRTAAPAVTATASASPFSNVQPWVIWTVAGVGVVSLLALLFRRR